VLEVGELLEFMASSHIGDAILNHGSPIVALSDDFLSKHMAIHVGFALPAVDFLHHLFNVSSCDAV